MKKIFLIAASLLVLNINAVNACSCIPTTPQQSLKNSREVFAGKVIDIVDQSGTNPEASGSLGGFKVIFEVSKLWKGKPENSRLS